MAIAGSIASFMQERGVDYDIVHHRRTETAKQSARAAHVRGGEVAKGVLLEDGEELIMAVVPASRRVDPTAVSIAVGRPCALLDEDDLSWALSDCRRGAVPPLGEAYGIRTVVDRTLLERDHVYFEAGDHEELLHVRRAGWALLMSGAIVGAITS